MKAARRSGRVWFKMAKPPEKGSRPRVGPDDSRAAQKKMGCPRPTCARPSVRTLYGGSAEGLRPEDPIRRSGVWFMHDQTGPAVWWSGGLVLVHIYIHTWTLHCIVTAAIFIPRVLLNTSYVRVWRLASSQPDRSGDQTGPSLVRLGFFRSQSLSSVICMPSSDARHEGQTKSPTSTLLKSTCDTHAARFFCVSVFFVFIAHLFD